MAEKYEPDSIAQIIATREFPRAPLTEAERAVFVREHSARIEQQHKRVVDDTIDNVLRPWLAVLDQARSLRTTENAERFAQVTERMRNRAARSVPLRWRSPEDQQPASNPCEVQWSPAPAFDWGLPFHEEEVTTDTISSDHGGPGIYDASCRQAIPDEGLLSVGVGVGRGPVFLDLYEGVTGADFTRNTAAAGIWRNEEFPAQLTNQDGQLTSAKRFDVGLHARIEGGRGGIGPPHYHTWLDLAKGPEDDEAWHPVLVLGTIHLTLWGYPPATDGGPWSVTCGKLFLLRIKNETKDIIYPDPPLNEFDLSESLAIGPGAYSIGVFADAYVTALVLLGLDDLKEQGARGFAGIDMTGHPGCGIWAFECGGGPIRITSLHFCCRDFPTDVFVHPRIVHPGPWEMAP